MPKRTLSELDGGALAGLVDRVSTSGVPLPEDLLAAIFSHLDVAGRARASRVCRRWRAAALQPPFSTELGLECVLLTVVQLGCRHRWRLKSKNPDDLRQYMHAAAERLQQEAMKQLQKRGQRLQLALPERVLLAEDAAAALRGPLCRGLQRLRLGLLPHQELHVPALRLLGAALPPALRSLFLAKLATPNSPPRSIDWWRLLAPLELARTVPQLEELNLGNDTYLWRLELSHPTLRRLNAILNIRPDSQIEPDLRCLPQLRDVSAIEFIAGADASVEPFSSPSTVDALVQAGIRTKRLRLMGWTLSEAHACLLKPGAALEIAYSTPPPVGQAWSLPAGLAQLKIESCALPPTLLESLLHRAGEYAPRLGRLTVDSCTLSLGRYHGCRPHHVIEALERLPGGTQIEICWPRGPDWNDADVLARLARLLVSSPTLHRYVHVERSAPLTDGTVPPASDDFAEYRRARAAGLRGMGEEGRLILAQQGYDRDRDTLIDAD